MILPVLETTRLRSIPESDAPGLHRAWGDPGGMRFWDVAASRDVAQTAARIRSSLAVDTAWHGVWAIETQAGDFAGAINYHDREARHGRLALGWITVTALHGSGVMTEAAGGVLRHCFTAMDTHRIDARIEAENTASRRLAAKLGFTQ